MLSIQQRKINFQNSGHHMSSGLFEMAGHKMPVHCVIPDELKNLQYLHMLYTPEIIEQVFW